MAEPTVYSDAVQSVAKFPKYGETTIANHTDLSLFIKSVIVRDRPHDLEELAAKCGVPYQQLKWSLHVLNYVYNHRDMSEGTVYGICNDMRSADEAYHAQMNPKAAEQKLAAWEAERKRKIAETKVDVTVDFSDPEFNTNAYADRLERLIEGSQATEWSALADYLYVDDLQSLMTVCRTLAMEHGRDKLSSRSLYNYFLHYQNVALSSTD